MCEEGGKDGNEFQEPEKRRRLTILVQPNVCVCVCVCSGGWWEGQASLKGN